VDLEAGTVRIETSVSYSKGTFTYAEPKTARGRRTIQIGAELVKVLRAHRVAQLERRMEHRKVWEDTDAVFDDWDKPGKPLPGWKVGAIFRRLVKAADKKAAGEAARRGEDFHPLAGAGSTT
jgi:hypothetical protein